MNAFKSIALGLIAATGLGFAQEAAPKTTLKAYVHFKSPSNARPQQLELTKAEGGRFFYVDRSTVSEMNASPASCLLFFIQSTPDFVRAQSDYLNGDWEDAAKKLGAVRRKYASFSSLPGNPSTKAALLELDALAQTSDWEKLGKLAASFPASKPFSAADALLVEVAALLGKVSDDPSAADTQKAAAEAIIKDADKKKQLQLKSYGQLRYVMGRAVQSKIINGTATPEAQALANEAINLYCEAVVAHVGKHPSYVTDALIRAMSLLWDMPDAKAYVTELGAYPRMDEKNWKAAPSNFREAAAMAHILIKLYPSHGADEATQAKIQQIGKFYFDPSQAAK